MEADLSPQAILAARCTIGDRSRFLDDLRGIARAGSCRIILFNADRLAGKRHAALAVSLARRAFEQGVNISNTLEMEALLFAAGSRQCNVAAAFGVHEGENRLYVCSLPDSAGIRTALETLVCFVDEDGEVIGPEKREVLMRDFDISPAEISAAGGESRIVDLVLERVALLQVMR